MKIKQPCPRCGGKSFAMSFRVNPLRWKLACTYCKFMPKKPARTQWGAKRIWNRATCTKILDGRGKK